MAVGVSVKRCVCVSGHLCSTGFLQGGTLVMELLGECGGLAEVLVALGGGQLEGCGEGSIVLGEHGEFGLE